MSDHETFGQMVKRLRLSQEITLRSFCLEHNYDPANQSTLERGKRLPPVSEYVVCRLLVCLGVERQSDDWYNLFDLAAAENGRIPSDLAENPEFLRTLPELFARMRRDLGQPKRETRHA